MPPDKPVPEETQMRLAAERTMLAWVRTGLALMGFGFVVARFGLFLERLGPVAGAPARPAPSLSHSIAIGTALVGLGVVAIVATAARFTAQMRRLDRGEPLIAPRFPPGVAIAVVLALIGVALMVSLSRLPV